MWRGKINAALDRQHPRNLFDIRNLINEVGYSPDIKEGFIFFLLSSKRPMHELLNPHSIDQSTVFESQFHGMTDIFFRREKISRTDRDAETFSIFMKENKQFLALHQNKTERKNPTSH